MPPAMTQQHESVISSPLTLPSVALPARWPRTLFTVPRSRRGWSEPRSATVHSYGADCARPISLHSTSEPLRTLGKKWPVNLHLCWNVPALGGQQMNSMINWQLQEWAILAAWFGIVGWCVYMIAAIFRRKQQNDMQKHMLDRFSSAPD